MNNEEGAPIAYNEIATITTNYEMCVWILLFGGYNLLKGLRCLPEAYENTKMFLKVVGSMAQELGISWKNLGILIASYGYA